MSDQEPIGVFFQSSEDQDTDIENRLTGISDDQLSLWLQNAPSFSSISTENQFHDDLSSFEFPSSLILSQQVNPGENPCLEDIILHGFDTLGQSSGTEMKPASDSLEMQTKEKESHKAGAKEDPERKRQKRTHSTKVQNRKNERLRRQKITEKLKALQEMIPNTNKRDRASTIDDAIKYIKTLQYQVQMMSIGAGYSMFHYPLMMMPQPSGQQGFQIPSLGPFSGMFSSFNFPMSQLGLPNPCLLPSSSATSGLPEPGGI